MTTFGLEEEFILLDSETLEPAPEAAEILTELGRGTKEFLASQVEFASPVYSTTREALRGLTEFRDRLASLAEERGLIAAGVGVPFHASASPMLAAGERYRRVGENIRAILADHQVTGLHIHVAVPDRESGVRALNGVRPWLPVLLALGANSPYWRGEDTGFDSWRSILSRRWPTTGCPPVFQDAADYDRRLHGLIGHGGTVDVGLVAWNARLSENWPTLEIRVFDAQLTPEDSIMLAALCRALVVTSLERGLDSPPPELLDVALWHAARDGIGGELLDPRTGGLAPARVVVDGLLDHVGEALVTHGDLDLARVSLDWLFAQGTGATRQRRAHRSGRLRELFAA